MEKKLITIFQMEPLGIVKDLQLEQMMYNFPTEHLLKKKRKLILLFQKIM